MDGVLVGRAGPWVIVVEHSWAASFSKGVPYDWLAQSPHRRLALPQEFSCQVSRCPSWT